jgi:hypothetical protein
VQDHVVDIETIYLYDASSAALVAVLFGARDTVTCLGGPTTIAFSAQCESPSDPVLCDAPNGDGGTDAAVVD